jgi:hypothetical protein
VADIPCVKKGLDSTSSWKSPWLTDVFVVGEMEVGFLGQAARAQ